MNKCGKHITSLYKPYVNVGIHRLHSPQRNQSNTGHAAIPQRFYNCLYVSLKIGLKGNTEKFPSLCCLSKAVENLFVWQNSQNLIGQYTGDNNCCENQCKLTALNKKKTHVSNFKNDWKIQDQNTVKSMFHWNHNTLFNAFNVTSLSIPSENMFLSPIFF